MKDPHSGCCPPGYLSSYLTHPPKITLFSRCAKRPRCTLLICAKYSQLGTGQPRAPYWKPRRTIFLALMKRRRQLGLIHLKQPRTSESFWKEQVRYRYLLILEVKVWVPRTTWSLVAAPWWGPIQPKALLAQAYPWYKGPLVCVAFVSKRKPWELSNQQVFIAGLWRQAGIQSAVLHPA